MSKPYNLTLAHSHSWINLNKTFEGTQYEHCVDCGCLRLALYDPESVTDERTEGVDRSVDQAE